MPYVISDLGASIRVFNNELQFLLLKHEVKRITIRNNNIVTLVVTDPLHNVIIPANQVIFPSVADGWELAVIISDWIKECVCCESESPPL